MKLAVAIPVLLSLFVARHANAELLTFELYAMGLPVAESSMRVELAPTTYRMELRYHTMGIARLVSGDRLDQATVGTFARDLPLPSQFHSTGRLHAADRSVTLAYRDGDPTTTEISPPNEAEREIVPPARRDHTIDPLSAMVEILHAAARTGHCDLSQNTYDGRRLEVFVAHTVGQEELPPSGRSIFAGRGLRCDYSSQPIAGLKLGDGRDDDGRARKGTVWLAQVTPGGPLLPVRGVVDVRFLGAADMYLTAVTP